MPCVCLTHSTCRVHVVTVLLHNVRYMQFGVCRHHGLSPTALTPGESTPRSRLGLPYENTPPTDIRLTFSHSSCHFPIAAARRVTMDHIQPFSCAALGSRSHSAPSEAAPRAGASATANPKSRLAISIATATPASHAVAKPPIDLWLNWACQRPFRPG